MSARSRVLGDGFVISGTQVAAALGQLVSIRLLTEALSPGQFGVVNLLLGAVALISSGVANPTMQALLRFYPEHRRNEEGGLVRYAARRQFSQVLAKLLPLLLVAAATALYLHWVTVSQLLLLALLVAIDIMRMEGQALLNSVRAHRTYGIWSIMESLGRPLMTYLMLLSFPVGVEAVLLAFVCSSALSWNVMRRWIPKDEPATGAKAVPAKLNERLWEYTLPLLPLGFVGWVAGVADRYVIAGTMSPADVGLFVAVSGLASRPMLLIGSVFEMTIRPAYQQALAAGAMSEATNHLRHWFLMLAVSAVVAVVLAIVLHEHVATMVLGEAYRSVSGFIPWVVLGYSFLVISHLPTRICYAHGKTTHVLVIEVAGAVAAIVLSLLLTVRFGLIGAVYAIPLYYGFQLAVSTALVWPLWSAVTRKRANVA